MTNGEPLPPLRRLGEKPKGFRFVGGADFLSHFFVAWCYVERNWGCDSVKHSFDPLTDGSFLGCFSSHASWLVFSFIIFYILLYFIHVFCTGDSYWSFCCHSQLLVDFSPRSSLEAKRLSRALAKLSRPEAAKHFAAEDGLG